MSRLIRVFDTLSYVFLLLMALAVPLWLDKNLVNYFVIPKQYIFMGFILLILLFQVIKVALSKNFSFRRSVADVPLLIVLLAGFLSALLSTNRYYSFLGRNDYFILNFLFLFFLVVMYFVVIQLTRAPRRWRGMMDAVVVSGGLTSLYFVLKNLFGVAIPGFEVLNTMDNANSVFGIWCVAMFALSSGQLIKKELAAGRSLVYFLVAILNLLVILILGFNLLWWMMVLALILLLILGVAMIREARLGWLSVLFALLIAAAVFIIFNTPKFFQISVPAEVSLGFRPSWSISAETIFSGAKNFLLGSGLGTFGFDFSQFRSADFNYSNLAWALRFAQPFNTLFALVSEGGIIFALSLVFLALFVMGHAVHAWRKSRRAELMERLAEPFGFSGRDLKLEVYLLATVWIVLGAGMISNFFGPALWWLWWLVLGLIVSGLALIGHETVVEKEWTLEDDPEYNLAFSFSMIVAAALLIMGGVLGARLYMADRAYAAGIGAGDYGNASANLNKAIRYYGDRDVYHMALARAYLAEAGRVNNGEKEADIQVVADLVSRAVNEAKMATELSPRSVDLLENLALMYENAAVLVPAAREWEIKTLTQAVDLEPTSASLQSRLGDSYKRAGDHDKAIEAYREAIGLKSDYLGAYMGMAGSYLDKRQTDKAVETFKSALAVGGRGNPELLFNYGSVLYNRNRNDDRSLAEQLWLEATRLQPNYSNALYGLGLLYEGRGDKNTALRYYYKVKDLNPENKDIVTKIRSLVGRAASSTP